MISKAMRILLHHAVFPVQRQKGALARPISNPGTASLQPAKSKDRRCAQHVIYSSINMQVTLTRAVQLSHWCLGRCDQAAMLVRGCLLCTGALHSICGQSLWKATPVTHPQTAQKLILPPDHQLLQAPAASSKVPQDTHAQQQKPIKCQTPSADW